MRAACRQIKDESEEAEPAAVSPVLPLPHTFPMRGACRQKGGKGGRVSNTRPQGARRQKGGKGRRVSNTRPQGARRQTSFLADFGGSAALTLWEVYLVCGPDLTASWQTSVRAQHTARAMFSQAVITDSEIAAPRRQRRLAGILKCPRACAIGTAGSNRLSMPPSLRRHAQVPSRLFRVDSGLAGCGGWWGSGRRRAGGRSRCAASRCGRPSTPR
jgi:hypothetical protein